MSMFLTEILLIHQNMITKKWLLNFNSDINKKIKKKI